MTGADEEGLEVLGCLSVREIMQRAYQRHVLVPAFNVAYLPMVRPIAEAVKACGSFALIEVARPDIERFGAESYKAVKQEFERWADRRHVRLHEDHVPVVDEDGRRVDYRPLIEEALDLGYDSVMIDGSRLHLEENTRVSAEVVAMSRPAAVEAELGAVLGHEAGPLPPYEELFSSGRGFTDAEEAARFVRETGVDWLSVAIGNVHGAVQGPTRDQRKVTARLSIDRLSEIAIRTAVPLVLHGGSELPAFMVQDACRHGVTKINIGTAIRQAYERALDMHHGVARAQEAVGAMVVEHLKEYDMLGSARQLL